MRSQYALELIATLWFCLMGFAHMENTVIMHRLALAAGVIGAIYMTRAFWAWIVRHELEGKANAKNPKGRRSGVYAGGTRMRDFSKRNHCE